MIGYPRTNTVARTYLSARQNDDKSATTSIYKYELLNIPTSE